MEGLSPQPSLKSQVIPVDGAQAMMADLAKAGCKIAVATNDSLERTKNLMQYAGLAPYITTYACRDEVSMGKPAPELVQLACQRMGLKPRECAMVGDSVLDLHMAANADPSVHRIGVLTGASIAEDFMPYAHVILPSVAHIRICELFYFPAV